MENQLSSISDSLAISPPLAILLLVRYRVNGSRNLTPAVTARNATTQNTRTPKTVLRLAVVEQRQNFCLRIASVKTEIVNISIMKLTLSRPYGVSYLLPKLNLE